MRLSNLAEGQQGSVIRQMFNKALTIPDRISFTVGEPDFITPRPIIDAACKYWQQGLTHYTPNSGVPELRKAIAEYHSGNLMPNWENQIMIGCGATEVIQMALFTVVNPGDEVIVVTPAWPNYMGQIGMCGAVAKIIPTFEENGFVPDPDDIKKAINSKTKCIILNSPSNPTGVVIGEEKMRAVAQIIGDHDIYVIADEVYSRLVYDGDYFSITSCSELGEKVIYINSFSKMLAMTGWRLGYAIASPNIILNMTKLHENGASCLPAPSQLAVAEVLKDCDNEINRMRDIYKRRRDILCSGINNEIPGMSCVVPDGAFYVFANIKETGMTSMDFCTDLLEKTGVVTVPGSGFGDAGEGFIRFTYATSEENITEGIRRIKDYMSKR